MRKKAILLFVGIGLGFGLGHVQAAATVDLYESSNLSSPLGQIQTIATAQSGSQHYDYFSVSGHPSGVNLGPYISNIWVHENTGTGEYTFGFIFSQDNGGVTNEASLLFRVVAATAMSMLLSLMMEARRSRRPPARSRATICTAITPMVSPSAGLREATGP